MNTSSRTSVHLIAVHSPKAPDDRSSLNLEHVRRVMTEICEPSARTARVRSLANGVAGLPQRTTRSLCPSLQRVLTGVSTRARSIQPTPNRITPWLTRSSRTNQLAFTIIITLISPFRCRTVLFVQTRITGASALRVFAGRVRLEHDRRSGIGRLAKIRAANRHLLGWRVRRRVFACFIICFVGSATSWHSCEQRQHSNRSCNAKNPFHDSFLL